MPRLLLKTAKSPYQLDQMPPLKSQAMRHLPLWSRIAATFGLGLLYLLWSRIAATFGLGLLYLLCGAGALALVFVPCVAYRIFREMNASIWQALFLSAVSLYLFSYIGLEAIALVKDN